jgi:hypothetical protein
MDTSVVRGDNGKISLMRTMSLIVVLSVMSVFLAHNVMSIINQGDFVSIGTEEAMLIAGVLASKAFQRFGEGKRPMTPQDIPTDKEE